MIKAGFILAHTNQGLRCILCEPQWSPTSSHRRCAFRCQFCPRMNGPLDLRLTHKKTQYVASDGVYYLPVYNVDIL